MFDSSCNASLDHVAPGPQNLVPSKGCAHKFGENWDELRAKCNHQNATSLKADSFMQWWITQERTIIDPHPFLELDTAEQKVKAVLDLMEWGGHHDGESHHQT